MTDVTAIVDALQPVVASLGLALYDVEIAGSGRARVVRVLVDRPSPAADDGPRGIDLDAVAAATEAISPVLDAPPLDAWLVGPYSLEVSSPGLERPLRTPAHFRGALGDTVSVKMRVGDEPARRVRGVVLAADDTALDLVLDDGSSLHLPYDDVIQARTVFEWGPTPKRGKNRSRSAAATRVAPERGAPEREVVRP